jgi:hypothetical protein
MTLNNHTKEQFVARSGSYSTHGSRRGYSDLGLPLGINDLLDPIEKKKVIFDRINELNKIIRPSKKVRVDKNILHAMISDINEEIKIHRISSSKAVEEKMNFGMFFLDYCRRNMPKDQYKILANGAREEFERIN